MSASISDAQDQPPKQPVPKLGPQHVAEGKIRQKYKEQYSIKDSASRLALAKTLRADARANHSSSGAIDDPPMRFVLLREARELAIDAGDFHFATRCIDDIARDFAINPTEMKLSALSAGMDKADLSPDQAAEAYFRVVDDFLEVGDVDSAQRTMVLARSCERQAPRNAPLKQHGNEYEQKVAAARRALNDVVAASRKLQKDAGNSQLNQTVGLYLFNAGNFKEGIALLAKGQDAALREACTRDLAGPQDPSAMLLLADTWWALGEAKAIHASPAHRRAGYWYQKALSGLVGEHKVNAESQLSKLEDEDAK